MIIELKLPSTTNNVNISSIEVIGVGDENVPLSDLVLVVGSLVSGTIFDGVFNTDATGTIILSASDPSYIVKELRISTKFPFTLKAFSTNQQYVDSASRAVYNSTTGKTSFFGLGEPLDALDFFNSINTSLYDVKGFEFNLKSSSFADENGVTRYGMVDDNGVNYYNISAYIDMNVDEWYLYEWIPRSYYNTTDLRSSQLRLKFLSNLANLYEQQAPSVLNIRVDSLNTAYMLITVTLDKEAQCSVYGVNMTNGTEGTMAFYARDNNSFSTTHTYTVKKPTGGFKVIALPTTLSSAKDFGSNLSEVTALNSYTYNVSGAVESRYQEGYDLGYKEAHQQIYAEGSAYGWSHDFNTQNNYAARQKEFVDFIANGEYFKAYREVYDRGNSLGFSYDRDSTSRSYYLGQRDAFVSVLGSSGSIETYNRIYPRGAVYGFTYNNSSSDKTYYQNLEANFVETIRSSADGTGYKRAYGEIYSEGVTYQQLKGVPEGYPAFVNDVDTNINFPSKRGDFVRSMYNSGYLKASQTLFDLGNTYDYNFRTRLNASAHALTSTTVTNYYTDEFSNFVSTVVASSQIDGYVDVYTQIASASGWTFAPQGATNVVAYRDYLSAQKTPAISALSNKAKVEAYEDVFSKALGDYGFEYSSSTSAAAYSTTADAMLGTVYRRGLTSGVQHVYDKAIPYEVLTRTNYGSLKTSSPLVSKALNASVNSLLAVAEPAYDLVFNDGIVSEARRLYNYAVPYGFSYNAASKDRNYYFNLEEDYVDAFTSGAESAGIRKVFQEANTRFGFSYTNSNISSQMEAQIDPMMEFTINYNSVEALRGVFNIARDIHGVNYTNSSIYGNLAGQSSTILSDIKAQGGVDAYHYIFQQANTRNAYPYTGITNAVDMRSKVIPMFTWVENYRESDGYRRVHNYARNFLGVDYNFQDSPDPRVLENQVPRMFEYLSDFGGMGNLRYVLNTAAARYPGFTYQDNRTVVGLKGQIVPMFDFIDATTIDIVSVEGPVFTLPDITKMKVTLKTPMKIYCVVSNILSGELLAFYLSTESLLVHNITLKLRPDQFGPNTKVVFIPAERISN